MNLLNSRSCRWLLLLAFLFGSAGIVFGESDFGPYDLPEEGSVAEDELKKLFGRDGDSGNVIDRMRRELQRQVVVPKEDLVSLANLLQPDTLEFDRDSIESGALKYLVDNPATPFKAEIYYHLGAMYGPAKGNMPHDQAKLESYFKTAESIYGDSYSVFNRVIKTHLANLPNQRQERLGFYEWQLSFMNGQRTFEDVFPIRSLISCIKYKLPPELSVQEKTSILAGFVSSLPAVMDASENWLVRVASLSELNHYIQAFPGSSLAAKAAEVNQGKKIAVLHAMIEETLESPDFSSGAMGFVHVADTELPTDAFKITSPSSLSDQSSEDTKTEVKAALSTNLAIWVACVGGATFFVLLVAQALKKRVFR